MADHATAQPSGATQSTSTQDVAKAYTWSSPSLQMHFTFQAWQEQYKVGLNQVYNFRALVDATAHSVPSPNNDTLYSFIMADITRVPQIINLPDTGSRYLSAMVVDFRSYNAHVFVNKPGKYLLALKGYEGPIPDGVSLLEMESNYILFLIRTAIDSAAELPEVHAIQDQISVSPLVPTEENVHPLVAPAADANWVERMHWVIDHLPALDPSDADMAAFIKGLQPTDENAKIGEETRKHLLKVGEGLTDTKGMYGSRSNITVDDETRAASNLYQHLALENERAAYPRVEADSEGNDLVGDAVYTLTMPGDIPLHDAGFWSVTVYDETTKQFVPNEAKIYRMGDRTATASPNGDFTINFGGSSEGKDNWLALPADGNRWYILIRLYEGDETIANGTWPVPPIIKVS